MDLGMTAKVRPCVVVSAAIGDADRALITLVPHTTSVRGTIYEAVAGARFLKAGAFDAQGLVTVPVNRGIRILGTLSADDMGRVEEVLCRWLGLPCER